MRLVTAFMTVLGLSLSVGATHAEQMNDAIFDLVYDPAVIRYEPMPAIVRQTCPDPWDGRFWVYAHVRQADADFYLVNGISNRHPGDEVGDAFPLVVRIQGKSCDMEVFVNILTGRVPGAPYPASSAPSPVPGRGAPDIQDPGEPVGNYHYEFRTANEEAVVRGLLRDGIARDEAAWGRQALRAQVCPYKSGDTDETAYPLYAEEWRRYCAS